MKLACCSTIAQCCTLYIPLQPVYLSHLEGSPRRYTKFRINCHFRRQIQGTQRPPASPTSKARKGPRIRPTTDAPFSSSLEHRRTRVVAHRQVSTSADTQHTSGHPPAHSCATVSASVLNRHCDFLPRLFREYVCLGTLFICLS